MFRKVISNVLEIGRYTIKDEFFELPNFSEIESKRFLNLVKNGFIEKVYGDDISVKSKIDIDDKSIENTLESDQYSILKEKTVKELKSTCKDLGLKGYSRLSEDELIQLILDNQ